MELMSYKIKLVVKWRWSDLWLNILLDFIWLNSQGVLEYNKMTPIVYIA